MKNKTIYILMFLLLPILTFAGGDKEVTDEEYPSRPLNYTVCFSAGGESDITARMQQKYLEDILGEKIVIKYKPGGGGAVGWADLVKQKPDGYTIAGCNEPHTILQPMMRKDAGFETKDLVRIGRFQYTPRAYVVKKDSSFNSLEDLVKYAKANPGKVTSGGSGTWSSSHLAHLLFCKEAGVDITYIPYAGSGKSKSALLGGHIQVLVGTITQAVEMQDDIRVLAICSEERMKKVFTDVPTFKEHGYDVVEGSFRGVVAPPGTPKKIVYKLASTMKNINENPEFVEKMEELGFQLLWLGPEEYEKEIDKKINFYKEVLAEFGYEKK